MTVASNNKLSVALVQISTVSLWFFIKTGFWPEKKITSDLEPGTQVSSCKMPGTDWHWGSLAVAREGGKKQLQAMLEDHGSRNLAILSGCNVYELVCRTIYGYLIAFIYKIWYIYIYIYRCIYIHICNLQITSENKWPTLSNSIFFGLDLSISPHIPPQHFLRALRVLRSADRSSIVPQGQLGWNN